jgi:hypothetical protein
LPGWSQLTVGQPALDGGFVSLPSGGEGKPGRLLLSEFKGAHGGSQGFMGLLFTQLNLFVS